MVVAAPAVATVGGLVIRVTQGGAVHTAPELPLVTSPASALTRLDTALYYQVG